VEGCANGVSDGSPPPKAKGKKIGRKGTGLSNNQPAGAVQEGIFISRSRKLEREQRGESPKA